MQKVAQLLKKNQLIGSNPFKKFDSVVKLQNYISECYNSSLKDQPNNLQYFKSITIHTIKSLDRQVNNSSEKSWIRLIFIGMLINVCNPQVLSEEFVNFLEFYCEEHCDTQKKNSMYTIGGKVSNNFLSMKTIFSSIKKTLINTQTLKEKFLYKIVSSIRFILRKKLQNYNFFLSFRQTKNLQCQNPLAQDHLQQSQQKVWKIINHIKSYMCIINTYKEFQTIERQVKPLIIATFHIIGMEILVIFFLSQNMYPSIVQLVETELSMIKVKYDKIKNSKLDKDIKGIRFNKLSHTSLFIDLKNLIKQLEEINLTIMHVFYGVHHCNDMILKLPQAFILNSGNPKLDIIYTVEKKAEGQSQKRQKTKQNMLQLSARLQKSQTIKRGRLESIPTNLTEHSNSQIEEMLRLKDIQRYQTFNFVLRQKYGVTQTEQSEDINLCQKNKFMEDLHVKFIESIDI